MENKNLIIGGVVVIGGYLAYKAYQATAQIAAVAANANKVISGVGSTVQSAQNIASNFSSVSNAASSIASGLASLFHASGSGGRSPDPTTAGSNAGASIFGGPGAGANIGPGLGDAGVLVSSPIFTDFFGSTGSSPSAPDDNFFSSFLDGDPSVNYT